MAKAMFKGDATYDPNRALAVSNNELARWGVTHEDVSVAQRGLYRELAQTGKPPTWDDAQSIETQALIHGGMPPDVAYATVRRAIDGLRQKGIANPIRIPWSR